MSKMDLLFQLLALINPHLPMRVGDMQKLVMDYLIDNNTNEVTKEAMIRCQISGVAYLFEWFGMPPMYTDETRNTISILRIMDGSED